MNRSLSAPAPVAHRVPAGALALHYSVGRRGGADEADEAAEG